MKPSMSASLEQEGAGINLFAPKFIEGRLRVDRLPYYAGAV